MFAEWKGTSYLPGCFELEDMSVGQLLNQTITHLDNYPPGHLPTHLNLKADNYPPENIFD